MSAVSRRGFLTTAGALSAGLAAAPAVAAVHAPQEPARQQALRYRLGIVTYNVAAAWDVPTILRICRAVGLAAVELRTTHRHGVEPTLTREQRQEVRQRFADAGVELWGLGTVCEFHATDRAVVDRNIEMCRSFVQLAADLGARGVKVRPNGLPNGVPVARTLEQIGRALQTCGQAAADANVEIWVEVHGRGTAEPANMRTIMEQCNHPRVGVTWNSNPTDIRNGSVAEAFRMLRPWIKSCHINELYKDAAGTYPYRELFRLLRENGYDRVTLCEVGRTPGSAADGEELLRYYKALWTELTRA
jgi:sugar phosphate isomerase/epimerase